MERLAKWCKAEVRVVSLSHKLDLDGPIGAASAGLLLAVAQTEQEARRARQADGITAAKQRGVNAKLVERPKGSTKASPDRAKELASQGVTEAEIARGSP